MHALEQHGIGEDGRALLTGLLALHDAVDLEAFAAAVPRALVAVIPARSVTLIGDIGRAAWRADAYAHRLALRTPGAGRVLQGAVLARDTRFSTAEVALGALAGPHLAAAADHVRLRQRERERSAGPTLGVLTGRELQVLTQIADGRTDRDIAGLLHIEARTVEKHVEHIRAKLGARSRAEAVARWARARP